MTLRLKPILSAITLLFIGAVLVSAVWWWSLRQALEQTAEQAEAALSVASTSLTGELQQFRELVVILAGQQDVIDFASGAPDATPPKLRALADKTGSQDLRIVSTSGRVLATARDAAPAFETGAALRRAETGALGGDKRRTEEGDRVFRFAAPIFSDGKAIAAVVVDVDAWTIEASWHGSAQAVFFTDALGEVFVSNRPALILTNVLPDAEPATMFPEHGVWQLGRFEMWTFGTAGGLPPRSLHITRPLPALGLTAELLADTGGAFRLANLQASVMGAVYLLALALWRGAAERRRRLSDRLALQAGITAALETRVAERTQDLQDANANLRSEIRERQAAETRLKQAQADLVQAGKLAALGHMSAGISHELNQPLMAIRSFSDNALAFLDRGKSERVSENLSRISSLAGRMDRIIRNLRAFARQEIDPAKPVDLRNIVEEALLIAGDGLETAGIALDWRRPDAPIGVMGGDVRLQQVIVNLISNARDAMSDADEKQLTIFIEESGPVSLVVEDTGTGIDLPERVFDPFYSTKETGDADSLGLGLSISYGIVKSFDGELRAENRDDGGARFTVVLRPADLRAVA